MSFISNNPRQFEAVTTFLNLEVNGDPSVEDLLLYEWLDNLIDVCYGEAENYCGQPLRTTSVIYRYDSSKMVQRYGSDIYLKFIPYNVTTSLTGLKYRKDEFDTLITLSNTDYKWIQDTYGSFIAVKNNLPGIYEATLVSGFTDALMPYTILQGISEMVGIIYKQSPQGGNWFGLSSVASGGAGQTVNASLKTDIGWQKYFALYLMPTV